MRNCTPAEESFCLPQMGHFSCTLDCNEHRTCTQVHEHQIDHNKPQFTTCFAGSVVPNCGHLPVFIDSSVACMSSTLDELEEIERSARVGPGRMSPPPPVAAKSARRRGSTVAAPPSAASVPSSTNPSNQGNRKGEMLEDFPTSKVPMDIDPSSSPAPPTVVPRNSAQPAPVKPPENVTRPTAPAVKRGSVALKPMSGMGGLVDFDDSDFDDSDDDYEPPLPGNPMPGSADAVGGPNHRPLVGGFAAAAYEASRAHHYQSIAKASKPVEVPRRNGPPPSI